MKIITYNIHRGMDANDKITLDKMENYFKDIDCDIICLQEILEPQFKKLKLGLKMEGKFACNVSKPGMSFGVCILSKNKIEDSAHVFLTSKKEQRGFLCVNIGDKENYINIINTHLGLDKEERRTQINEILDYTNRLSGETILCGDFNEKNIYISKFKDMAVECNKYNMCTFEKSKSRIDYIFVSKKPIYDYYVEHINLSDHYPVIGVI